MRIWPDFQFDLCQNIYLLGRSAMGGLDVSQRDDAIPTAEPLLS